MSSQQNRGGQDARPIPAIQWGSMGDPSARLGTFVNWPADNPLRAADLAEAGFIHMGQGDMVKCVYCGVMIRNFEPGDTAMGEHSRYSQECPFVLKKLRSERQRENFRQIYSTQSESSGYGTGSAGSTGRSVATETSAATSGFVTGTTLQSRWPSSVLENSPIVNEKPRHPEFSTIQRRLATYNNWPSDKTQRPDMLSHAGFFYAGFNDIVKCFFCNGRLENWEPGDEPWTEHARWFPKCGYVKQCKGLDFINSIKRKQNESAAGTPPPSAPASRAPSSQDRTSEALMKPYARAVMELGYPSDMVKLAIENRFRDSGELKYVLTNKSLKSDSAVTAESNGQNFSPSRRLHLNRIVIPV
ncbi:inhibitor of apoptosis protein-like [Lingula anatina]|uniref:Inhibitor of apoptosis protein-like n=1 Tax=Lingula anatina TaxID=7574 RepID=A0A1S3JAW0_LINAN|nr:inhibitor of apoptosis protein-like [Lingula anatina]|eukprot:XP_013407019.1 inhibitor of apoptosis protein-like [Lingula anatina]